LNEQRLLLHSSELEADKSELEADKSELEADKADLESFGYSVSHDLHSPVRAMLGFTRALQLRCEHLLDDEGRRLLDIVQSEAARMQNLIDDLLLFSQIGSGSVSSSSAPASSGTMRVPSWMLDKSRKHTLS
jgi:signal transduction histidine kinase